MCNFCDNIYPEKDLHDIIFSEGNYPDGGPESFIVACDDGTYDIVVNPGDPYELGSISNIKFCPYCGMGLPERIRFDNGGKYDIEMVTRGRCMMCGKELTEGLFFCKECEEKITHKQIKKNNKNFIKKNFKPIKDKPGYVWFNKRDSLIISIETFAKLLEETWVRTLFNLPLGESEDR